MVRRRGWALLGDLRIFLTFFSSDTSKGTDVSFTHTPFTFTPYTLRPAPSSIILLSYTISLPFYVLFCLPSAHPMRGLWDTFNSHIYRSLITVFIHRSNVSFRNLSKLHELVFNQFNSNGMSCKYEESRYVSIVDSEIGLQYCAHPYERTFCPSKGQTRGLVNYRRWPLWKSSFLLFVKIQVRFFVSQILLYIVLQQTPIFTLP